MFKKILIVGILTLLFLGGGGSASGQFNITDQDTMCENTDRIMTDYELFKWLLKETGREAYLDDNLPPVIMVMDDRAFNGYLATVYWNLYDQMVGEFGYDEKEARAYILSEIETIPYTLGFTFNEDSIIIVRDIPNDAFESVIKVHEMVHALQNHYYDDWTKMVFGFFLEEEARMYGQIFYDKFVKGGCE